jgi:serine/threonine-protein kinase
MASQTIGRYEIIRELGIGGMAVVYLGMDPVMRRQVAIKVLPRQFTFDPQFRSRFQREAQVIAGLEHPAIVPVYDFGELNDQPFIVMRYMPGGSLADRMEKASLTLTEIANLFQRLASALDAAHHNGLVHRDLKPANILFDQWGESYLSDFGIVKLAEAHSAYTGSAIIGTPAYMSPEQAKGKALVDGRSDVYSLGIILYELLTQKLPYVSDTPMGQAVAHIIEPVPDILNTKPTLPKASDAIIRRALAKNPDDRFPTAGALANVVAQLATNPNLVLPAPVVTAPAPAKPATPAPALPKPQPQKTPTPLPPMLGRPSTGQTILATNECRFRRQQFIEHTHAARGNTGSLENRHALTIHHLHHQHNPYSASSTDRGFYVVISFLVRV